MLLEEAAYQQNIVLQASQAVNTCLALHEGMSTGSSEEVEAERLLRFSSMCIRVLFNSCSILPEQLKWSPISFDDKNILTLVLTKKNLQSW